MLGGKNREDAIILIVHIEPQLSQCEASGSDGDTESQMYKCIPSMAVVRLSGTICEILPLVVDPSQPSKG